MVVDFAGFASFILLQVEFDLFDVEQFVGWVVR